MPVSSLPRMAELTPHPETNGACAPISGAGAARRRYPASRGSPASLLSPPGAGRVRAGLWRKLPKRLEGALPARLEKEAAGELADRPFLPPRLPPERFRQGAALAAERIFQA